MRAHTARLIRITAGGTAARAAGAAAVLLAALGAVAVARFGATMRAPDVGSVADAFPPGTFARNLDYRHGTWTLAALGTLLAPAGALALALTSRRWAPGLVARVGASPWRLGAAFGVGLTLVNVAIGLPLRAAGYGWGRHFGLITQPAPSWALDVAKASGVSALIAAATGAVAAVAIARRPRSWWAWLAATGAALVVLGSLVAPVVIEPLFQRTRPLNDAAMVRDIRDIAAREGVDARTVLVNDASARTSTANAYVSGFGASRRIVLYDTLLRDYPPDQVRMVVAHEVAHVARRHVPWGTALGALAVVPVCLIAFAVVTRLTGEGPGDAVVVVRRLSQVAAVVAVLGVVATPLSNAVSRAMEREADDTALSVTRDPAAAEGLFRGFVTGSLAVPEPPAWVNVWFGTHPTLGERIATARAWRRG